MLRWPSSIIILSFDHCSLDRVKISNHSLGTDLRFSLKSCVSNTHDQNIICRKTLVCITYFQPTWWALGQWKGRKNTSYDNSFSFVESMQLLGTWREAYCFGWKRKTYRLRSRMLKPRILRWQLVHWREKWLLAVRVVVWIPCLWIAYLWFSKTSSSHLKDKESRTDDLRSQW